MKIKQAIKWQNGMVMVFDDKGQQVPELQGPYEEVREKVLAVADKSTKFDHGVWMDGAKPVSREDW